MKDAFKPGAFKAGAFKAGAFAGSGVAPPEPTTPALYVERVVRFSRSVASSAGVTRSVERSVAFDDV